MKVKRHACKEKFEPLLLDVCYRINKMDNAKRTVPAMVQELIKSQIDGPIDGKSEQKAASAYTGMR